jgi:hypothetical protein
MDWTYRAVRVSGSRLPMGVDVHEIDAIYYMVTSVFGHPMSYVRCKHCGWPHLDKDFFSVHPHQRHLCAGCGEHFRDSERGIGNPIIGVRQACGVVEHQTTPSQEKTDIRQADYPGGIQIWGSNPAFLWTGGKAEAEGIHLHAFLQGKKEPELDETYGEVIIDGVRLDPEMVRVLMAQNVMPSLKDRVRSIGCPACRRPHSGSVKLVTPSRQRISVRDAVTSLPHGASYARWLPTRCRRSWQNSPRLRQGNRSSTGSTSFPRLFDQVTVGDDVATVPGATFSGPCALHGVLRGRGPGFASSFIIRSASARGTSGGKPRSPRRRA